MSSSPFGASCCKTRIGLGGFAVGFDHFAEENQVLHGEQLAISDV